MPTNKPVSKLTQEEALNNVEHIEPYSLALMYVIHEEDKSNAYPRAYAKFLGRGEKIAPIGTVGDQFKVLLLSSLVQKSKQKAKGPIQLYQINWNKLNDLWLKRILLFSRTATAGALHFEVTFNKSNVNAKEVLEKQTQEIKKLWNDSLVVKFRKSYLLTKSNEQLREHLTEGRTTTFSEVIIDDFLNGMALFVEKEKVKQNRSNNIIRLGQLISKNFPHKDLSAINEAVMDLHRLNEERDSILNTSYFYKK